MTIENDVSSQVSYDNTTLELIVDNTKMLDTVVKTEFIFGGLVSEFNLGLIFSCRPEYNMAAGPTITFK